MKSMAQIMETTSLVVYIEQGRWDIVKKKIKVVYDQRVGIYPDKVIKEIFEQEGLEWK
jgi:hypothetical protein